MESFSLSSKANTLIFLLFGLVCFLDSSYHAHMLFSSLVLPCSTQLEALPFKPPPTGMLKMGHKVARIRQNTGSIWRQTAKRKGSFWLRLGGQLHHLFPPRVFLSDVCSIFYLILRTALSLQPQDPLFLSVPEYPVLLGTVYSLLFYFPCANQSSCSLLA